MFKILNSIGLTYSGVPKIFISSNASVVELLLLSEAEGNLCLWGGSQVSSSLNKLQSLELSSVLGLEKDKIRHLLCCCLQYKRRSTFIILRSCQQTAIFPGTLMSTYNTKTLYLPPTFSSHT